MFADVTSRGSRGDRRSNNQIDVSSDELNERYRSNDEAKRKIDSEIREMEQWNRDDVRSRSESN